ncbi:uncharacterized protein Z518_10829 [Rhinocladiella mackenziei CBS 650.93]|uniref:N-acetyltransferase domain-containing protein n=1 Tax=Rhinocladiella mackenziei CBS 650.93 TaxID=1442369 RepID=A0A0D2FCT5_9EURO|nr:uncharacterized protein Z518_10829 [Rhinocladiella mackenziei CBS 650.93]KIW99901.1 hypothetical protein Z518_10829 [Rhinocladiella mackenziei CBS 650.93]
MASLLPLRILSSKELQHEHTLLTSLLDMINEAYKEREEEGSISRFPDSNAMLAELGDDGLYAVVQDPGKGNIPVAVVGITRWKRDNNWADTSGDCYDWEISPAASRNEPPYRRQGLVDRCLTALSNTLLERSSGKEVRLWMKVVENLLGEYWKKKGFEQVGPQWIIPKGKWHKDLEFILIDMCKKIPKG